MSTDSRISRLMFFCAVAGANSSKFAFAVRTKYSKYLALSNTRDGTNPTTLSGKQASNARIPLSAIFAAMVMQKRARWPLLTLRQTDFVVLTCVGADYAARPSYVASLN